MKRHLRSTMTVTNVTVLTTLATILLCMAVCVAAGALAVTQISDAKRQTEQFAAENTVLREEANRRDEYDRCQAAVRANNGLLTNDLLEAFSGLVEANARGLSTDAALDNLTAAREQITEDRTKRETQATECAIGG